MAKCSFTWIGSIAVCSCFLRRWTLLTLFYFLQLEEVPFAAYFCLTIKWRKMKKGILLFSKMKTKPQSVSWRHFFGNDLRPCTSCEVSKFDNSLIEWKRRAPLVISWCFKKVKSHRDFFFQDSIITRPTDYEYRNGMFLFSSQPTDNDQNYQISFRKTTE